VYALKSLDHPNIIKLYEIYQDEKYAYLVQELCTGGELIEKILKNETFTEIEAADIFR